MIAIQLEQILVRHAAGLSWRRGCSV